MAQSKTEPKKHFGVLRIPGSSRPKQQQQAWKYNDRQYRRTPLSSTPSSANLPQFRTPLTANPPLSRTPAMANLLLSRNPAFLYGESPAILNPVCSNFPTPTPPSRTETALLGAAQLLTTGYLDQFWFTRVYEVLKRNHRRMREVLLFVLGGVLMGFL